MVACMDDDTLLQLPPQCLGSDPVHGRRTETSPDGSCMPFQPLMDAYKRARSKQARQAAQFALKIELTDHNQRLLEDVKAGSLANHEIADAPDDFQSNDGIADLIVREVLTKREKKRGNVRKTLIFPEYRSYKGLRRFAIEKLKHVLLKHFAKKRKTPKSTDSCILDESWSSAATVRNTILEIAFREQFSQHFITSLENEQNVYDNDKLIYCFHKMPYRENKSTCHDHDPELLLKFLDFQAWRRITNISQYLPDTKDKIVPLVCPSKLWGANTKLAQLIRVSPQTITQTADRAAPYLVPLLEAARDLASAEALRQANEADIPE